MAIGTRSYTRGYLSSSGLPPGIRALLISNVAVFIISFFAGRRLAGTLDLLLLRPDTHIQGQTGSDDPLILSEKGGLQVVARNGEPWSESDGFKQFVAGVDYIDRAFVDLRMFGGCAHQRPDLDVMGAKKGSGERPRLAPFQTG